MQEKKSEVKKLLIKVDSFLQFPSLTCTILMWLWVNTCLIVNVIAVATTLCICRAANYCRTSDNVRLNLANVRAKVILIGHWSDHKKNCHIIHFLLWQNPIANSLHLHFAIKFTRHSSILLNVAREWLYILVSCYIYLLWRIYVRPNLVMLVSVRPNSSYVWPKLKVIGQMSCQVKYLFAALYLGWVILACTVTSLVL
jgi:hypothetical protein